MDCSEAYFLLYHVLVLVFISIMHPAALERARKCFTIGGGTGDMMFLGSQGGAEFQAMICVPCGIRRWLGSVVQHIGPGIGTYWLIGHMLAAL